MKIEKLNSVELMYLLLDFDYDLSPFVFANNDFLLDNEASNFIVAFDDFQIFGILKFLDCNNEISMVWVDVNEKYRNKKIGSKLIEKFFKETNKVKTTISFECQIGKIIHIHNLFKRYTDSRELVLNSCDW